MTKEDEKLNQKLKIIHWLESLRWANKDKIKADFETSFYHNKSYFLGENCQIENAEAILLTHYLVYICDRQMDYRYIFKAGGYTVSWLVEDFLSRRDNKGKDSIKNLFKDKKHSHISPKKGGGYSYFLCASLENAGDDIRTYFNNYYGKNTDEVSFSSRFMVIDLLCMYKTLLTLCEEHNGRFEEFLKNSIRSDKPLYSLAESFYKLTYRHATNKITIENDNIDNLFAKFDTLLPKSDDFDEHKAKRIWCLARDFVYHPVFSECFETLVGKDNFEKCKNDVASLELPGDVWNNNLTFAKCFWLNDKGADIKKEDKEKVKYIGNSSKYVRERYEEWCKNNNSDTDDLWLPKDFDVTFNFVPKMCSQDKCSNCPLANTDKALENSMETLCFEQCGKLCPLAFYTTGIEYKCCGKESCGLHKIMNESK